MTDNEIYINIANQLSDIELLKNKFPELNQAYVKYFDNLLDIQSETIIPTYTEIEQDLSDINPYK